MTQQHIDQSTIVMENPGDLWRQEDLVAAFVERTTAQAEQRRVLFDVACDLFPFEPGASIRVLDIGAGYGAFAAAVLARFPNATAVGLDISEPMMAVGREHMARFGDRFSYHVGDMADGELPADLPGPFDVAIASAAILHLPGDAKQRLYAAVFSVLNPGGCFFNVDQVSPANEEMQAWYRERRERELQRRGDQPEPPNSHALMPDHHFETEERYRQHQLHHHLETEADQLAFLRAAGFVQVDCFYKHLLQTVIGGYKPGESVS
jgi:tRNA (cmo5U34)-methyltransferase